MTKKRPAKSNVYRQVYQLRQNVGKINTSVKAKAMLKRVNRLAKDPTLPEELETQITDLKKTLIFIKKVNRFFEDLIVNINKLPNNNEKEAARTLLIDLRIHKEASNLGGLFNTDEDRDRFIEICTKYIRQANTNFLKNLSLFKKLKHVHIKSFERLLTEKPSQTQTTFFKANRSEALKIMGQFKTNLEKLKSDSNKKAKKTTPTRGPKM